VESHERDPTTDGVDDPWNSFHEEFGGLGRRIKDTYRKVAAEGGPSDAEIKDAFGTLLQAWDQVAESVSAALQDPEVRQKLKAAAGSFAAAVGNTISELGTELSDSDRGQPGESWAHPLISVDQLSTAPGRYRICDLRWDLTDPHKGRATYEAGHIPGAVFVDLDHDLSAPPGIKGRHPLPDVADFAALLGRIGIAPGSHVVVYDDAGGRIAARLWWMLRAIGFERVQVLDGGYQAWVVAGYDVEHGNVDPEPTVYPEPMGFDGVVDHDQLHERVVVDAREAERYRGEFEPVDPKAGHIPGAVNVPTSLNLGADGHFRPREELAVVYSGVAQDPVVSCGSGVTSCHNALAMVVAGHDLPDVYVGSFSEWSRRDLPVATGPNP
jgi:thiosulfate/3-mercaptopyruvate sulfurtransferase